MTSQLNGLRLTHGDALAEMAKIPSHSIDAVICDPPYGTTACKWDTVIPVENMWAETKRITKETAPIVLFGAQPFSSILVSSNLAMFKYQWVWFKNKATGHLNCKKRPLVAHEDILVFYKKQCLYRPQGLTLKDKPTLSKGDRGRKSKKGSSGEVYGVADKDYLQVYGNYPKSVLPHGVDMKALFHSTQKPLGLMEYLVETYTQEGDLVLDFAMGSGTTGVACANTNRRFIGIETKQEYYEIAAQRVLGEY